MNYPKSLKILLLAALSLMLCACSILRPAPQKIDPPPSNLVGKCSTPEQLKNDANAQDLGVWTLDWIKSYKCEAVARAGLIEAWPK